MNIRIGKFYDIADECYKYCGMHGTGLYYDCYEDALRDELIGLGILIPNR